MINNEMWDLLHEGIIIVNTQGIVLKLNSIAERLFNTSATKAVGKKVGSIVPGSPLTEVLAKGKDIANWSERRGGKYLTSKHTLVVDQGEIVGAMSMYLDVSELERTKNKLKDSSQKERELDTILEHSHDGIWIMDGKGITLRVSKSWENFSGIKREDLIGKSVYEIVAQGIYSDSAAIHVIRQRKPVTIVYTTKTGRKALVSAVPIFDGANIWRIVSNVRDITELSKYRKELEENNSVKNQELSKAKKTNIKEVITKSRSMEGVFKLALQTANSDATVLILGESGVGKDVLARFIHRNSGRSKGPFINVNCGAIPENLMESELFGYEEGSFTGAKKNGKPGMFELAENGTLFLDEIGEIPIQMQAKLLHVLQNHSIMRVGGMKQISINVRILAATNQDLKIMIEQGKFRKDLYYRLNVIPIAIPSLRERSEDIAPLIMHFLAVNNEKYNLTKKISSSALDYLLRYNWPGNVRELENLIERLVLTCSENVIDKDHLPSFIQKKNLFKTMQDKGLTSLKEAKEELEKEMVAWALENFKSTRKAASFLGVAQPTIVRMSHKYNLK